MNHILKTVMLSGAVALCATLFACGTERDTSPVLTPQSGNVCDTFCKSQGGSFYLMTFATSETACFQKGGDWYTADQGYPGPPPGCCCKCALINGNCL